MIFYQSEWIEFYTSRGINLMMWNYRGYGYSEGSPTTGVKLQKYLNDLLISKILTK